MNSLSLPERLSARERLLAAAQELFYDEGVNTVGIDRVIARAGVAKASLYNTFGSKEELVRAYLTARHETRRARVEARLAGLGSARERILGVFDVLRELAVENGFRGCAFVRASAELRPGSSLKAVCDQTRRWLRTLLTDLARDAGARDPAALAAQLVLLYDGATVGAQMDADTSAAASARSAAAQLVDLATAKTA